MRRARWGWLGALALLVPGRARAQCTVQPFDATIGIPLVFRAVTPQTTYGTMGLGAQVVNVQDCGAKATTATDQTTALQNAITFACAQTQPSGAARPTVYIPPGTYAFSSLTITCNGLTLAGGGLANESSALCSSAAASGTMLVVGTAATPVREVVVRDIEFSGFCGGFPAGIDVTCNRCQFTRVQVTGYSVFAFRFLGAASIGSGGFSNVTECSIQNGQANSFAFVTVTQTGSTGGPDGQAVTNCFVNIAAGGFINDSTVAGATQLASSTSYIGNRFNSANAGASVAIQGNRATTRFTSNRWENTGGGGLTITVSNAVTTDVAAIFTGNLWACGTLLCTYTDNATTHAIRQGDVTGPSTAAAAPGVLCSDASATTSGAGSPVTLKSCTVTANTLHGAAHFLRVWVWGHTANNANAKTASIVFGGVTLITITETVSAADNWSCLIVIGFRTTGSAAQSVGGECSQGATGTVATPVSATPTLNFTVSNTVSVSVTQVAAADMIQDGQLVEVVP